MNCHSRQLVFWALLLTILCGHTVYAKSPAEAQKPSRPLTFDALNATATTGDITVYSPSIRVKLLHNAVSRLTVRIDGPYRVCLAETDRTLAEADELTAAAVVSIRGGLRVGLKSYAATRIDLVPIGNTPGVWVGTHLYADRVRLLRADDKVIAINVLPLERYLASVVDGEMPASFPASARRSQAIVARTYALWQMTTVGRNRDFDVYASTRSQKYNGLQYRSTANRLLAGESASARAVVRDTAGIVCVHDGKLFCTYYAAVCGGQSVLGTSLFSDAAPPLQCVDCDWCKASPRYRWQRQLSKRDVTSKLLPVLRKPTESWQTLQSITTDPHATPDRNRPFAVTDGQRTESLTAGEISRRLGFDSPFFTVKESSNAPSADHFEFLGRGHGHGVGLCQWGAAGQGKAHRDCITILTHYYPGVQLVRMRPPSSK